MLIRGYKRPFRDFSTAENKARKRRDCNAWSNHMDDINSDDNRSDEDWKSDNREEDLQQISAKHYMTDELASRWYRMMSKTVELLTDDFLAVLPSYFGGPRQARLSREIELTSVVQKLQDLSSDIVDMCNDKLLSKKQSEALTERIFKKRKLLEDLLILDSLLFLESTFEGVFLSCFSSPSIPRSSIRNYMKRFSTNLNTLQTLLENGCLLESEIVQRGWLVLNFDAMPDEVFAEMIENKQREPTYVALKDMFRIHFLDVPLLAAEAGHDVCLRFNFIPNALQEVVKQAKERGSHTPERRVYSWLLQLIDFVNERQSRIAVHDEEELKIAIWGFPYDNSMAHKNRMALDNY